MCPTTHTCRYHKEEVCTAPGRVCARNSRLPALTTLLETSGPVFVSAVTPKVSGATVVGGALHSVAGRGLPFSQDHQKVATCRGEKARGMRGRRGHRLTFSSCGIKQRRPKKSHIRRAKRSFEKQDGRGGIRQHCSMLTTAWSPRWTLSGSRAHLTPW